LGNGTDVASIPEPVRVSTEARFVLVDVGESHTCGLTSTGEVLCWGGSTVGQLGDGRNTTSLVPVLAEGVDDATDLSVGHNHACVIRSDRSLWCWGHNTQGQGGSGEFENLHVPTRVQGISDVAGVVAASHSTCAWQDDGAISCWGMVFFDQQPVPLPLSGADSVAGMAFGPNGAYQWTADGRLSIAGEIELGAAGYEASWEEISFDSGIIDVAVGISHTCALDIDGAVWCWGRNEGGQVGTGTHSIVSEPTRIDI